MAQTLTKLAEEIAARAVAAEMQGATLEVLDKSGDVLVRFGLAESMEVDASLSKYTFESPGSEQVIKMGVPATFRVLRKASKEVLMTGTAGKDADLPIPADKLFQGMKVTMGGIEFQLRFK